MQLWASSKKATEMERCSTNPNLDGTYVIRKGVWWLLRGFANTFKTKMLCNHVWGAQLTQFTFLAPLHPICIHFEPFLSFVGGKRIMMGIT